MRRPRPILRTAIAAAALALTACTLAACSPPSVQEIFDREQTPDDLVPIDAPEPLWDADSTRLIWVDETHEISFYGATETANPASLCIVAVHPDPTLWHVACGGNPAVLSTGDHRSIAFGNYAPTPEHDEVSPFVWVPSRP